MTLLNILNLIKPILTTGCSNYSTKDVSYFSWWVLWLEFLGIICILRKHLLGGLVKKNGNFCLLSVQVNHCQKLLFLHLLTHNMTTDCSLNFKFNTWKFQAQTWGEHVVYRNCFWHSEQFLYTTCSPHVLQKEELLTKIYL